MSKAIIFLITLFTILPSCKEAASTDKQDIVASIGEKLLYRSDIPNIFPQGISADDSIRIAHKYISNLVKLELLREKAENNLTDAGKQKIEKQLNSSRTSLYIHEYENKMMKQRIDTLITEEEAEAYYNDKLEKFSLQKNIIKALYIKLPVSAPHLDDLRTWYKSEKPEDLTELESYCYQYATKYDDFNEDWIYFDELVKMLPLDPGNQERYLRRNKNTELSDSTYHYFVHIDEFRVKSETAPFEFVRSKINDIIFNERKIRFIVELENNIYNDAREAGNFVIY